MGVTVRKKKSSGQWCIFIRAKGQRRSKAMKDKGSATKLAKEIRSALAAGDFGLLQEEDEPQGPTLAEYLEQYLAKVKGELKKSTFDDYEGCSRRRLVPELGDRLLTDIRRVDVKNFMTKLRQEGLKDHNVSKHVRILSTILSEAVEDELIPSNPALELRKLRRSKRRGAQRKRIVPPTAEENATLLSTALTHAVVRKEKTLYPFRDSHPFMLLLSRTGMRLGEAVALKWGDIDWRGGTILVERSYTRGELSTPKNGKSRKVDMSKGLRKVLREQFDKRFQRVAALDPERQAELDAEQANEAMDAWVFPGPDGKGMMDEAAFRRRIFKPLLVAAKLRHMRIHDLRHGYASLLLSRGADLKFVSEQLGHHSAAFTLQVYTHLMPGDRHGLVDMLDDLAPNSTPVAPTADNAAKTGVPEEAQASEVTAEK